MPPDSPAVPTVDQPLTDLTDQRVIQVLSTEHWSLLSARALAYNEAFTRGGMFLTFLSASLVALALFNTAMSFGSGFLVVAALVLAFDFIIGVTTYGRIMGANVDDLRAVHGMARIRHGYTQIAPVVAPYFTSATNDDFDSVISTYGTDPSMTGVSELFYALTTSGGMIGLITAMVGGVLAAVIGLLVGVSGGVAVWLGVGGGILVFLALVVLTFGAVPRQQASLTALFPARGTEKPAAEPATDQ
jgi:hypothetical protein